MRIGIQTWGSEGDIRPFVALAGGLAEAGHSVTLVVAGVKKMEFSTDSESVNFRLIDLGHVEYHDDQLLRIGKDMLDERNPLKQIQMALNRFLYPLIDKIADASHRLCEENGLLIRHFMVYPLGIAAELKKNPVFRCSPRRPRSLRNMLLLLNRSI